MFPALHDSIVVSYWVHCEERRVTILVRSEPPNDKLYEVNFTKVEGCHFRNDAFGNIVLALEEITARNFVSEYGTELATSSRESSSLGEWAKDVETACRFIENNELRAFLLSSSYGLNGWVLAKNVELAQLTF